MTSSSLKPIWFIAFVVVGLAAVVTVSKWRQPKEVVAWRKDFASAQAEAAKAGKPVFAYFGATWCGPCQEMRRTAFSDARVAAALEAGYVPVHVDVDEQPTLAKKYVPTPSNLDGGIPAFRVIDPNSGAVTKEMTGGLSTDLFLQWLSGKMMD